MLETLKQIDTEWFLAINNGWQNSFMDWLCPWLRQPKTWTPLYAVALWFSWKVYGKQALWVAIGAGLLILVADQFSANLIKRDRPAKNFTMLLAGIAQRILFRKVAANS